LRGLSMPAMNGASMENYQEQIPVSDHFSDQLTAAATLAQAALRGPPWGGIATAVLSVRRRVMATRNRSLRRARGRARVSQERVLRAGAGPSLPPGAGATGRANWGFCFSSSAGACCLEPGLERCTRAFRAAPQADGGARRIIFDFCVGHPAPGASPDGYGSSLCAAGNLASARLRRSGLLTRGAFMNGGRLCAQLP